MVRFKVIKGSHVLLGIAIAVLLAVALFIGISAVSAEKSRTNTNSAEAKVSTAFASSNDLRIEIVPDPEPSATIPPKSVLIYHTHTHEAYEQVAGDPYEAIETWRTEDIEHSVVRVGKALAEALRGQGLQVVHDMTDHELDDLSTAYVRSLQTLDGYKGGFDLYIDLHRDAFSEGMLPYLDSGSEYAQLMLLVGRGDKYSGQDKPDYDANLDFAQKLTQRLNNQLEGICRNVTVKTGRYNQHIGTPSILIEFGHNKNTLQQALNSVPIAAEAIAQLIV